MHENILSSSRKYVGVLLKGSAMVFTRIPSQPDLLVQLWFRGKDSIICMMDQSK